MPSPPLSDTPGARRRASPLAPANWEEGPGSRSHGGGMESPRGWKGQEGIGRGTGLNHLPAVRTRGMIKPLEPPFRADLNRPGTGRNGKRGTTPKGAVLPARKEALKAEPHERYRDEISPEGFRGE
jgi:hypothetical protein